MRLMINKYFWTALIMILLSLLGLACRPTSSDAVQGSESPGTIPVSSSAFAEGELIPAKYTCDGEDISPPLMWSGVPENAHSAVLIMDDPDAPVGTWVHWVLYDLPADIDRLDEGDRETGVDGVNSWNNTGYGGPCPPAGDPHRYYFKLYILDTELYLQTGATKAEIEKAMQGHILVEGQLMGKYGR